ncbi:MAG: hypothetical protein H7Y12_12380 [Sphingobacteriaceae bacterium]|nr:hypothetical protein [Cytophagaceae bacterium]
MFYPRLAPSARATSVPMPFFRPALRAPGGTVQRDVGWAKTGRPYGPPMTSEVDQAHRETIVNAPAGYTSWNGTFGWQSRFHLSFDLNTNVVTVIVRLYSTATSAVRTAWESAIESRWSRRFSLRESDDRGVVRHTYPIGVDVQWASEAAGAHYTIAGQAAGTRSGGRYGLSGTSSMTDWGTADAVDITHEFGHMLGNAEEYFTTNGTDYTAGGTRQGYRDAGGGIMNNPSENPEQRHFEAIRAAFVALRGLPTERVTLV